MPNIEAFCKALKISWLNKILDPLHITPWKTLFMDKYSKFGADNIWLYTKNGIRHIASKFNRFWKDVFFNWSLLCEHSSITTEGILRQPIWFNDNLKINDQPVFYRNWCNCGIFFINDLLDESNEIMSLQKLKDKYNLETSFLQYLSIKHMIPREWKECITQAQKLDVVSTENLDFVKNNKKCSKLFYKKFLKFYLEPPEKQQKKWNAELNIEIENWDLLYTLPFKYTKQNKLILFQYKIFHRILTTNSFLFKCKLKETELCTFCQESKETVSHLLWDCPRIRNFWIKINEHLENTCNITLPLSKTDVLLGTVASETSINFFIALIKYYIYCCRCKDTLPNVEGAVNTLKKSYKTEKLACTFYRCPAVQERMDAKWGALKNIVLD